MSELTREDLIEYCKKNQINHHGNAGFNTLKALVDEHVASMGDDAETGPELSENDTASVTSESAGDDAKPDSDIPGDDDSDDDSDGADDSDEDAASDEGGEPDADDDESDDGTEPTFKLKNISGVRFRVFQVWLKPGETITPTAKQMESESDLKRAKRAVVLKLLKEV